MKRLLGLALGLGLLAPVGAGGGTPSFASWEDGDANLFLGNLDYWWASRVADAANDWNEKTAFRFKIQGNGEPACKRYAAGVLLRPEEQELRNGVEFGEQTCGGFEDFDPGVLAVCHYFTGDGGFLLSTGIIFNEKHWSWSVYDGPFRDSEADFHRVALHELGHFMGLDHNDTEPSILATFVTDITELQQADIDGANQLYAPPPPAAPAQSLQARCGVDQLQAARSFCKAELRCEAKHAADPAADANGAARDACVAGAETALAAAWDAAVAEGAGACSNDASGASTAAILRAATAGAVSAIGSGDPGDAKDGALRAKLLRKAGALCSDDLAAWKKEAAKSKPAKLEASLAVARERFEEGGAAAIARAAARGVVYEGANLPAIAEGLEALAAQLGASTAP
jgi:hypothetical protein